MPSNLIIFHIFALFLFIYLMFTIIFEPVLHPNLLNYKAWFILRLLFWFMEYTFELTSHKTHLKHKNLCIILCVRISYVSIGFPITHCLFEMKHSMELLVFIGSVFLTIDIIIIVSFVCGGVLSWRIDVICR